MGDKMNFQINENYLTITINNKFSGKTVNEFFIAYHISAKNIRMLSSNNVVFVNSECIQGNFNYILKMGDMLKFPLSIEKTVDFIPQYIPLKIIYEDDFILAIDKQKNIIIHPEQKTGLNTLVNGIAYHYTKNQNNSTIRYIHRLDKDTTGIIIFVKNYFVHNLYDYLFRENAVPRYYLAVVVGNPKKDKGVISASIGRDRHNSKRYRVSPTGKKAVTKYKVLRRYADYSLLELELITGRTHQIRVHLQALGHPVLGDALYNRQSSYIDRPALHAKKITLPHPISLRPFSLTAPLPDDIKKLL